MRRALFTAIALAALAAGAEPPPCRGQEAIAVWLADLREGPPTAIRSAASYVAPESTCQVRILVSALDDAHPLVRRSIARALGDSRVVPRGLLAALVRLMGDEDRSVREDATLALVKHGAAAVPLLAPELVRYDAAGLPNPYHWRTDNLPGPGGMPRQNLRISDYAAIALIALGADAAEAVVGEAIRGDEHTRRTARYVLVTIGEPALPAIRPLMHAESRELRLWAIDLALEIAPDDTESCAATASLMPSPDGVPLAARCRALIGRVVEMLDTPQHAIAASSIVAAIQQTPSIGVGFVHALAGGTAAARKTLVKAAPRIASIAAASPQEYGAMRTMAISLLRTSLRAPDAELRRDALAALQAFGADAGEAAVDVVHLADEPDPDLRAVALSTLGAFGPAGRASTPDLLALLHRAPVADRERVVRALVRVSDPAVSLPALREMLTDPATTTAAIPLFGEIGEAAAPAVPELISAARDEPSALAVVDALSRVGRRALPAILELAQRSPYTAVRCTALRAAVESTRDDPNVASARRALAADPDSDVRDCAVAAMPVRLAAADAHVLATAAVDDPDPEVREGARAALRAAGASAAPAVPVLRAAFERTSDRELGFTAFVIEPAQDLLPVARELLSTPAPSPEARLVLDAADRVWRPLLPLLDTADADVVANILATMLRARTLTSDALAPATSRVDHPDATLRAAALSVIARLGEEAYPARERIAAALADGEKVVREAAASAWLAIGGGDDPAWATVAADRYVERFFAARLETLVAAARPPSQFLITSAISLLPELKLPPPRFSAHDLLASKLLGAPGDSLGAVHARLDNALRTLGYDEPRLFAVPGGFALLTKLERVDENGRAFQPPNRWTRDRLPPSSLSEYLEMLFLEKPGRFRLFAFVITTLPDLGRPVTDLDEQRAEVLRAGGGVVLPHAIASMPYADRYCHVLIYVFEKRPSRTAVVIADGLGWLVHVTQAGILAQLGAH